MTTLNSQLSSPADRGRQLQMKVYLNLTLGKAIKWCLTIIIRFFLMV